jgi:hypothetical protein
MRRLARLSCECYEQSQSHFAIDFAFRELDGPFVSRIYKRTRRMDSGTALA